MPRDDFSDSVKRMVGERVGHLCSEPDCGIKTVAAKSSGSGRASIGVAAHIRAASPGGARYDSSQSAEDRKSLSNAIWLCSNHAALIDKDPDSYPLQLLNSWKRAAEERSRREIGRSDNQSTGQSDTSAGPIFVINGAQTVDVVGGDKIVFEAPRKEPLPHWLHRPGRPEFRIHPASGPNGFEASLEFSGNPLPPPPEVRYHGAGFDTGWCKPKSDGSPKPNMQKYHLPRVVVPQDEEHEALIFEVRFYLDDGQYGGRWIWPLRRHAKGHWDVRLDLGSGALDPEETW